MYSFLLSLSRNILRMKFRDQKWINFQGYVLITQTVSTFENTILLVAVLPVDIESFHVMHFYRTYNFLDSEKHFIFDL